MKNPRLAVLAAATVASGCPGSLSIWRPRGSLPIGQRWTDRHETDCLRIMTLAAPRVLSASRGAGRRSGQLNVICSVQAEWCNMIQTVFAKTTGIKVNMSLKGSGEALAQLIAEKANPKTDVWFGGTGDPHLQAAEQGLTLEYKSPALPQLHPWAQQQAAQSQLQDGGHLLRAAGLRLQHRAARQEEDAGAEELGRPAEARSTRARSRSPTRPPAAPPTRWWPRWCS